MSSTFSTQNLSNLGNSGTTATMATDVSGSSGYLCPATSDVYKFKWASICLVILALSGGISMLISMATIWLESFASGFGVFVGSVFVLTAVIGFRTYENKTGSIILLFLLTFADLLAGSVTVEKASLSLKKQDYWCDINTMISFPTMNQTEARAFTTSRCQAGVALDLLVGGCAVLGLIAALVLLFVTLRGIPCGKRSSLSR